MPRLFLVKIIVEQENNLGITKQEEIATCPSLKNE